MAVALKSYPLFAIKPWQNRNFIFSVLPKNQCTLNGVLNSYKIIFLLLLLSIIPGCSKGDDNTVSEAAEKVVDAMFTAPNPKLFTSETATVIGEGISEKEQSEQKEEIEKNWEDLLGKYFEMGRLEYFISTYGQQFLFEADSEEKEIYVKEIELVDQTDTSETVLVKYMDGEKEKEEKIYFQYDQDGLIRDVYPLRN